MRDKFFIKIFKKNNEICLKSEGNHRKFLRKCLKILVANFTQIR